MPIATPEALSEAEAKRIEKLQALHLNPDTAARLELLRLALGEPDGGSVVAAMVELLDDALMPHGYRVATEAARETGFLSRGSGAHRLHRLLEAAEAAKAKAREDRRAQA